MIAGSRPREIAKSTRLTVWLRDWKLDVGSGRDRSKMQANRDNQQKISKDNWTFDLNALCFGWLMTTWGNLLRKSKTYPEPNRKVRPFCMFSGWTAAANGQPLLMRLWSEETEKSSVRTDFAVAALERSRTLRHTTAETLSCGNFWKLGECTFMRFQLSWLDLSGLISRLPLMITKSRLVFRQGMRTSLRNYIWVTNWPLMTSEDLSKVAV